MIEKMLQTGELYYSEKGVFKLLKFVLKRVLHGSFELQWN